MDLFVYSKPDNQVVKLPFKQFRRQIALTYNGYKKTNIFDIPSGVFGTVYLFSEQLYNSTAIQNKLTSLLAGITYTDICLVHTSQDRYLTATNAYIPHWINAYLTIKKQYYITETGKIMKVV